MLDKPEVLAAVTERPRFLPWELTSLYFSESYWEAWAQPAETHSCLVPHPLAVQHHLDKYINNSEQKILLVEVGAYKGGGERTVCVISG